MAGQPQGGMTAAGTEVVSNDNERQLLNHASLTFTVIRKCTTQVFSMLCKRGGRG